MEKANSKLGRQDWVNAALNVLSEEGAEAVKVDILAKSLKITRGSFYWHFKNLDDLLEAIIHEWQTSSQDIAQTVEQVGGEPSEKLLHLFEIAARNDDRLEKAMRVWAIHDARAATAVAQVDRQRLEYLQYLFLQLGFSKIDAEVRAQIAYSVRLGWFIIAIPVKASKRMTETHLVHAILTRSHDLSSNSA
jgi:AcrR family transcriptional regulator